MVPDNLPTGDLPTIGYAAQVVADPVLNDNQIDEVTNEMKELEDRAHAHKVLLSSDAMRHFISVCPKELTRLAFLEQVIGEAKVTYPSEDGWVVLNCERMQEMCEQRKATFSDTQITIPDCAPKPITAEEVENVVAPTGISSLAEAIVTGNIAAAYQMIGRRPMIALADASADLDALYRKTQGETTVVSDMLLAESSKLDTEQIKAAITALTSALDGTYDSEEQAVKMAIMKATKAIS